VKDLQGLKRNGRRAMKPRDGDFLAAVTRLEPKLALFSKRAAGLVIAKADIPVRDSAAVGVSLMGVRDDDALVAAIGFSGSVTFSILNDAGKTAEIKSSDVLSGHRALKGNKVIARGEIKAVKRSNG
jgi:DNA gyrase/topoisomerase IV subunit A